MGIKADSILPSRLLRVKGLLFAKEAQAMSDDRVRSIVAKFRSKLKYVPDTMRINEEMSPAEAHNLEILREMQRELDRLFLSR